MIARPAAFRQADVKRVIQAATDAVIKIARIEVCADGRIIVHTTTGVAVEASDDGARAFDEWVGKHGSR
jgi:hypothetical protein